MASNNGLQIPSDCESSHRWRILTETDSMEWRPTQFAWFHHMCRTWLGIGVLCIEACSGM